MKFPSYTKFIRGGGVHCGQVGQGRAAYHQIWVGHLDPYLEMHKLLINTTLEIMTSLFCTNDFALRIYSVLSIWRAYEVEARWEWRERDSKANLLVICSYDLILSQKLYDYCHKRILSLYNRICLYLIFSF